VATFPGALGSAFALVPGHVEWLKLKMKAQYRETRHRTSVQFGMDGDEFIYFYLFRAVNLNGYSPVWCGKFKYRTDAVN